MLILKRFFHIKRVEVIKRTQCARRDNFRPKLL